MTKPSNVVIDEKLLVPSKKPREAGDDLDEGKNSQRIVKVKLSESDSNGTSESQVVPEVEKESDKLAESEMGGSSQLGPTGNSNQIVGSKIEQQPSSS
jgi:hypothetical protein